MAAPSKFLALSNEVMFLIMDCLTTREQLPLITACHLSQWRWSCIHTIPFAAWQNLKELDIDNCVDPLCFAVWGDCHAPDARRTNVFPVLPSLRRLSGTICIVRTIIQYAPGVTHLSFKPSSWGCEFRAFEPQSDFPPYLPNICHAEHVAIDPPVARDSRFEELLATVFPKMSNVNHIQFTYYRGEMKVSIGTSTAPLRR
ncbi:hypothetical protein ONZ45_g15294 [Pleurotus djamor]|nr:hypothetical protein ONZ45_g15294 [Pleurotus djamor]